MTMVPLVDMLNHRRPPQTEWHFDQAAQAFVLSTTEEVARDEQLFDSYGAKCNSRYLLNYGFTVEDNRGILWRGVLAEKSSEVLIVVVKAGYLLLRLGCSLFFTCV